MKERKRKMNGNSLLKEMEIITTVTKKSGLLPANLKKGQASISQVAKYLDCTPRQASLFSIILNLSFSQGTVCWNDIADHLKCSNLKIASMMKDFETLERKMLIRTENSRKLRASVSEICYKVSKDVLEMIFEKKKKSPRQFDNMELIDFLVHANMQFEEREMQEITYDELMEEILNLKNRCRTLPFVRQISSLKLIPEELILLLYVCSEAMSGNDSCDLGRALEVLYDCTAVRFGMKRSLIKRTSNLMKRDILCFSEGSFLIDREIKLTDTGLDMLFGDDKDLIQAKKVSNKSMVLLKNLPNKKMFYNPEDAEKIDFLCKALLHKNFTMMQARMEKHKMQKGFAILFHGPSGTGKTETVYQLARRTGREVMMVDISKTKTCWFGESEKLIKRVFDDYRKLVAIKPVTPILLFNEADGIFARRKENGFSSVDQTENAIQNIILQELENLNGILIATTNLTCNLDSAFERRFLYKLEFHKPNNEAKMGIWKDKIQKLSDSEAKALSGKFELSGGQIDNIAKKYLMKVVLENTKPNLAELESYCREESSLTKQSKIGF